MPGAGVDEAREVGDVISGDDGADFGGESGDNHIDVEVERVAGRATLAAGVGPEFGRGFQGVGSDGFQAESFAETIEQTHGKTETFEDKIAANLVVDDRGHDYLHLMLAQSPKPKLEIQMAGRVRRDEPSKRAGIENDGSSRQRFCACDRCCAPSPP